MTRALLALGLLAAGVVALDQWTKSWATRTLAGRESLEVLGEFVRFTYTRNSGIAFGLGAGLPVPYAIFSIAAVVLIIGLFLTRRAGGTLRRTALALILGGAIGNLIDRLDTGQVVDFIEIGFGYGRWNWPIFNIADSAVTIGVVLFAFGGRGHDAPKGEEPAAEPGAGDPGSQAEPGRATGSVPGRGADRPLT